MPLYLQREYWHVLWIKSRYWWLSCNCDIAQPSRGLVLGLSPMFGTPVDVTLAQQILRVVQRKQLTEWQCSDSWGLNIQIFDPLNRRLEMTEQRNRSVIYRQTFMAHMIISLPPAGALPVSLRCLLFTDVLQNVFSSHIQHFWEIQIGALTPSSVNSVSYEGWLR